MTTVCSILQKMLEKAGITKTCEEILKTMADTQRYTGVSKRFKYIIDLILSFFFILYIDIKYFSIYFSLEMFQSEEMPSPEPLTEGSLNNEDDVEYVDDSIYSGSST